MTKRRARAWPFGVTLFPKKSESRIAIADPEIAEDLIVGAILTDDVDDVLDLGEHVVLDGLGHSLVHFLLQQGEIRQHLFGVSEPRRWASGTSTTGDGAKLSTPPM